MLLRRQIARRCIYGVDINEIAVELARLAVWIHTFVPGLPLSFLNHGLIHGNSLTGVGTLDEIVQTLNEAEQRETKTAGDSWLLPAALADFMDRAGDYLDQLATLADASIADVTAAAKVQANIEAALAPLAALCDLITAERTTRHLKKSDPDKILLSAGGGKLFTVADAVSLEAAILTHPHLGVAREIARTVSAAHLPVRYPEVFRRDPSGFDVMLGNPPWEKLKVEEHSWWSSRFRGVQRGVAQEEKNRLIAALILEHPDLVTEYEADVVRVGRAAGVLTAGPYEGIGATDIDLYAAFCWRFWQELRLGGRTGVVLPRNALSGAATVVWRREVLREGAFEDATTLANNRHWVFDEVHPQQTIVLLTIGKGLAFRGARLRGPFSSLEEFRGAADNPRVAVVPSSDILAWSDSVAIPSLPPQDLELFAVMKRHPSLGSGVGTWRFRPMAELHTTKNKPFFHFDLTGSDHSSKLPVWTGGSFNIWEPMFGDPYAYAETATVESYLQERRLNQIRLRSSAFFGMPEEWATNVSTLPLRTPRIAFRDVTKNDNSRTMLSCLIPPGVALVHPAPFLLRVAGTERDEAYLLAILSSIPFDWFTRRFVELHMTFELLNSFPVPRVDPDSGHSIGLAGELDVATRDLRAVCDRAIEIAGRLAAVDERYVEWAASVGVAVGSVKSAAERDALVAELDALVSLLYALSRDQVEQVFASFHRGWDYRPRLAMVLEFFDEWSEKVTP